MASLGTFSTDHSCFEYVLTVSNVRVHAYFLTPSLRWTWRFSSVFPPNRLGATFQTHNHSWRACWWFRLCECLFWKLKQETIEKTVFVDLKQFIICFFFFFFWFWDFVSLSTAPFCHYLPPTPPKNVFEKSKTFFFFGLPPNSENRPKFSFTKKIVFKNSKTSFFFFLGFLQILKIALNFHLPKVRIINPPPRTPFSQILDLGLYFFLEDGCRSRLHLGL